jgi:hypothetical protein
MIICSVLVKICDVKSSTVTFSYPTLLTSSVESNILNNWEAHSRSLCQQQMFRASDQGWNILMSYQDMRMEASRNPKRRPFGGLTDGIAVGPCCSKMVA